MVIVNAKAFKRLDAKTQKIVELAAQAAEARGWDMAMAETDVKTAMLAEKGINVATPTLALKKGLQAIGKTMGDEWAKTAGDDGAAILKALQ
jgi:TRAP-type C4-dicarboxylate transport system substrate-binding protein